MDRQAFLSSDELRAGLDLVRQVAEVYPVEVAFWLKYVGDERYILCIASSGIEADRRDEVQFRIFQWALDQGSSFLDPMAVIIIDVAEPITIRALALRQDYVGITRSSSQIPFHRGMPVETIYVYSERHLLSGVFN